MTELLRTEHLLGMTPRQIWFKNRVSEIVAALGNLHEESNWDEYRAMAFYLANELNYAVTEWEKLYQDE